MTLLVVCNPAPKAFYYTECVCVRVCVCEKERERERNSRKENHENMKGRVKVFA